MKQNKYSRRSFVKTHMLSLQNISKSYNEQNIALQDISLEIKQAEIVFIVGESGSGKSTLVKIMAGLLNPDGQNASIYLNQEKLYPTIEKLIAGYPSIKILQQNNPLLPFHNVFENLRIPLRSFTKEYQEKRIGELLKLCHLQKVAQKLPRELSGGQLQRIALAQTLAEEPSILLLDEPFSHLDTFTKNTIREDIFKILRKHKITTVCISHDTQEALSYADRILVIKEGKIIQQGTPENIYQYPKNSYIATLFGNENILSAEFSKKYFNKAKKACIRTEHIQIASQKTPLQAVVQYQKYIGRGYEILCTIEKQKIRVYSLQKIEKKSVFLEINEENIHFF
ncbi:MAG: ABC transporter ATP-binding protein [Raineya sp.]|jgi:ABC-type Fe3+/spermidine/putrescine transport system ATPase subunit|nr:ABC transporter ATP-binding protein [Raineya sp.]